MASRRIIIEMDAPPPRLSRPVSSAVKVIGNSDPEGLKFTVHFAGETLPADGENAARELAKAVLGVFQYSEARIVWPDGVRYEFVRKP